MKIEVVRGSLLDQDVEVIVNAANTSMRGGGGIDGAIHRAAGPGLIQELMMVAPHGARTGEVVVTGGHNTGFQYIFHVAGPFWSGGKNNEEGSLRSCYENSMQRASDLHISSIGFCSISTGIYRFPLQKAVQIALGAVQTPVPHTPERVVFAIFGDEEFHVFSRALAELSD